MNKILLAMTFVTGLCMAGEHKVSYPKDYRTWTHVKSMVINDAHSLSDPFEGMHHVYGNNKALDGLNANTYKNGATFVFDLLSAERTKEATVEGKRKFIGVMTYDNTKFKKTGNWGFEAFAGDSKDKRVVKDSGISCFQCHVAVEQKSYVFTEYRK